MTTQTILRPSRNLPLTAGGQPVPIAMAWKCPACGIGINHQQGTPRPHVVYRCHVCRLELVCANQLMVVPLQSDVVSGSFNSETSGKRRVRTGAAAISRPRLSRHALRSADVEVPRAPLTRAGCARSTPSNRPDTTSTVQAPAFRARPANAGEPPRQPRGWQSVSHPAGRPS